MMSKDMRESFEKVVEGASFETLCELKRVLAERIKTIKALGAIEDGSEEKMKIVEKAIEKKNIERRIARMLRKG